MDIDQTFTALTQNTASKLGETSEMTGFPSPAAGAETSSLSLAVTITKPCFGVWLLGPYISLST